MKMLIAGLLAAGTAILLFTLGGLDWETLRSSLLALPPATLATVILLQVLTQLLISLQWYGLCRQMGLGLTFGQLFRINCEGACIEAITPGVKVGGEVTRTIRLSQAAASSKSEAASLVAFQKLFSFSAFFFLVLLSFQGSRGRGEGTAFLLGLVLLFFLTAVLAGPLSRHGLNTRNRFFGKLFEAIHTLRGKPVQFTGLLLLSLGIWLIYPLKLWLLGRVLVPGLSFLETAAPTFSAYLVALIPIFPGGVGGFEGTLSALLVPAGFTLGQAVALALVFRFITFWLVILGSTLYLLLVPMKGGRVHEKIC